MTKIMRLYGIADGEAAFDGPAAYLAAYDADQNGFAGLIAITSDPSKAMRFVDAGEALACWKRQSATMPIRPDGKPNRPLTAFHAEIMDAPEGTDEDSQTFRREH